MFRRIALWILVSGAVSFAFAELAAADDQPAPSAAGSNAQTSPVPAGPSLPGPPAPMEPPTPGAVPPGGPPVGGPQPQPGPLGGLSIPGLGNLIRPDGLTLPGGLGSIQRAPDHLGIHINTPDGPFDINLPRRQRDTAPLEDPPAPGNGTDVPFPAGRPSSPLPPPSFGRPGAGILPPNRDETGPSGGAGRADRASHEFRVASHIFRARNYAVAARHVNRGLERAAGDPDLLQLRSLVSFALSDYPAAARDAGAALAENQFWDWSTLRSMYRTAADYTTQYRALETQAVANPNAPELWLLLAYHNLVLGNRDTARRQFARVAALDPANGLAQRFSMLEPGGNAGRTTSAAPGTARRSPTPAADATSRGPSRDDPFSVDLGKPASPGQPGGGEPK
jgi:hypothetical protein